MQYQPNGGGPGTTDEEDDDRTFADLVDRAREDEDDVAVGDETPDDPPVTPTGPAPDAEDDVDRVVRDDDIVDDDELDEPQRDFVEEQRQEFADEIDADADEIVAVERDEEILLEPGEDALRRQRREFAEDVGILPHDVRVDRDDGQVQFEADPDAIEREVRHETADEWGVDPDHVAVEDGEVRLEEEGQEELLRQQVEEEYPDAEDVDIVEEDGELVAEVELPDGEQRFWDDPVGRVRDVGATAVEPFRSPRESARDAAADIREPVDEFIDDPADHLTDAFAPDTDAARDHLEDIGTAPFRAQMRAWEAVGDVADELDEEDRQQLAAAGALAATPEPTPATEIAGVARGAAIVGGAAVGAAGVDRYLEQDAATIDEVHAPEIETPTRREPVSPAEVEVPERRVAIEEAEIEAPETQEPVSPAEVDAPERREPVEVAEIEVPERREPVAPAEQPTIDVAEQMQIGEQRHRRRRRIGEEEDTIITPEDLVDPDELRQEELEELREQVEEQAAYVEESPEDVADEEAFVFPSEPTIERDVVEQPEVSPLEDVGPQYDTGVATRPAAGVDELADTAAAAALEEEQAALQDVTPTLQAQETAMQQALSQALATPDAFADPTATEVATEYPTVEATAAVTATRPGRRLRRPHLRGDFDDLDPAGDLDAALDEERVEWAVPDPDDIGINPGDFDDFTP